MDRNNHYDYVIVGAGIFGLYTATLLMKKKCRIAILEINERPFSQASFVNQARVHNGYHYPRSLETATKCAYYYDRFCRDFSFAINRSFSQVYAISNLYSKVCKDEYIDFCQKIGIPLQAIDSGLYFKAGAVEAAFITEECSFDTKKIGDYFLKIISDSHFVDLYPSTSIEEVSTVGGEYALTLNNKEVFFTPFVINATYAGVNQVIDRFNFEKFKIKYELCEVILCETSKNVNSVGITVMDGPFFSLMPFGQSGLHSITSVGHTPHQTCYECLPEFRIKSKSDEYHTITDLSTLHQACELPTAWDKMAGIARSYLKDNVSLKRIKSMYAIKPILLEAETNDDRPTVIRQHSCNPSFVSILSGKINTIYDLDEFFK